MPGRTPEGDALTALVLPVFALNGEFLETAVLEEPLPVAEIARRVGLGLTRQSVQRVTNDVVAQGWARWQPNPGRRGQNLLVLTDKGRRAVAALTTEQHAWADAVGQEIGEKDLKTLRTLISRVTEASRQYRQAAEEEPSP